MLSARVLSAKEAQVCNGKVPGDEGQPQLHNRQLCYCGVLQGFADLRCQVVMAWPPGSWLLLSCRLPWAGVGRQRSLHG